MSNTVICNRAFIFTECKINVLSFLQQGKEGPVFELFVVMMIGRGFGPS